MGLLQITVRNYTYQFIASIQTSSFYKPIISILIYIITSSNEYLLIIFIFNVQSYTLYQYGINFPKKNFVFWYQYRQTNVLAQFQNFILRYKNTQLEIKIKLCIEKFRFVWITNKNHVLITSYFHRVKKWNSILNNIDFYIQSPKFDQFYSNIILFV